MIRNVKNMKSKFFMKNHHYMPRCVEKTKSEIRIENCKYLIKIKSFLDAS